jgi:hypothetical protein
MDEPIVSGSVFDGPWEVHICRKSLAAGDACITVTREGENTVMARGRGIRLLGVWDVVQWSAERSCGASVTVVSDTGEWRVIE